MPLDVKIFNLVLGVYITFITLKKLAASILPRKKNCLIYIIIFKSVKSGFIAYNIF